MSASPTPSPQPLTRDQQMLGCKYSSSLVPKPRWQGGLARAVSRFACGLNQSSPWWDTAGHHPFSGFFPSPDHIPTPCRFALRLFLRIPVTSHLRGHFWEAHRETVAESKWKQLTKHNLLDQRGLAFGLTQLDFRASPLAEDRLCKVKAELCSRGLGYPLIWPRQLHSGAPHACMLCASVVKVYGERSPLPRRCLASKPLTMLFHLPELPRTGSAPMSSHPGWARGPQILWASPLCPFPCDCYIVCFCVALSHSEGSWATKPVSDHH